MSDATQRCPQCQTLLGQTHTLSREEILFCPVCQLPQVTVAGKYRIERRLAEGGCGILYLARHTRLRMDPIRVIKFLRPEMFSHESMGKRFEREVEVTAAISQQNQHIVRVYDDFGEIPKLGHYFVMEYLEGQDLGTMLLDYLELDQILSLPQILHIVIQVCEAIGAAHQVGIVHRDLKPENIFLITRGDDPLFVKVIDFGIAKSENTENMTSLTKGAIGTPEYMAPEQCTGSPSDARTDVYALGTILYQLLVGHTPYLSPGVQQSANLMYLAMAQLTTPAPPPSQANPAREIPSALEQIVMCALEKKAEDRFQSMAEMARALRDFSGKEQNSMSASTRGLQGQPTRQLQGQPTRQVLVSQPMSPVSERSQDGLFSIEEGKQEGVHTLESGPYPTAQESSGNDTLSTEVRESQSDSGQERPLPTVDQDLTRPETAAVPKEWAQQYLGGKPSSNIDGTTEDGRHTGGISFDRSVEKATSTQVTLQASDRAAHPHVLNPSVDEISGHHLTSPRKQRSPLLMSILLLCIAALVAAIVFVAQRPEKRGTQTKVGTKAKDAGQMQATVFLRPDRRSVQDVLRNHELPEVGAKGEESGKRAKPVHKRTKASPRPTLVRTYPRTRPRPRRGLRTRARPLRRRRIRRVPPRPVIVKAPQTKGCPVDPPGKIWVRVRLRPLQANLTARGAERVQRDKSGICVLKRKGQRLLWSITKEGYRECFFPSRRDHRQLTIQLKLSSGLGEVGGSSRYCVR